MRWRIVLILLLALLWSPAASAQEEEPLPEGWVVLPGGAWFNPWDYLDQGDAYSCPAFASQAAAQAVLRADSTDPNRLDADRDGIACESNRAPFDRELVERP